MFFPRALLISACLAGLVVPTVLAVPSALPAVDVDARGGVVNTGLMAAAQKVITGLADVNKNAGAIAQAKPHDSSVKAMVMHTQALNVATLGTGSFLSSGGASGVAGALFSCLSAKNVLGPILSLLGSGHSDPVALLDGILKGNLIGGNLLGGVLGLLNPIVTAVLNLLNGLGPVTTGCGCQRDAIDALVAAVLDLVNDLVDLLSLAGANGCPCAGATEKILPFVLQLLADRRFLGMAASPTLPTHSTLPA
ncbi:hypothetical protein B0H19DRAFT_1381524 [Mycena capillaripes]|nr:hypothetical protein B0H19DRAFT_1381524 [Mycena capillaripes]